ncbi:hypothetical protein EJB05_02407, partial [Eragrostis curvula]
MATDLKERCRERGAAAAAALKNLPSSWRRGRGRRRRRKKRMSTIRRTGGTGPTTCSPISSTRSPAGCSPSTWPSTAASAPCAGAGAASPPTRAPRRFHPRNWAVLTITPRRARWGSTRRRLPRPRRLLNLATAASLGADVPALASHCHMCAADGLLVLLDRDTTVIRVVDPLSNAVTDFPALSSVVDASSSSSTRADSVAKVFRKPWVINLRVINGAGFDDSTSPPTLVLCLRGMVSNIIVAKPGDAHWTLVAPGDASYPEYDAAGKLLYLSWRGRCYLTSPEGSVYVLELQPLPRLVGIIDQRSLCAPDRHYLGLVFSFLVPDGNGNGGGRMLMVRYWKNIKFFGGIESYRESELFTVAGVTGRIEVLELDLAGRRLVPVRSLGRQAVFAGETHCVLVATETFPSLAADTVYLGYRNQRNVKFSAYDLNSRGTEPPHQFCVDEFQRVLPCARPCNLDQYLACYVDRAHALSSNCIGHASHENDPY